VGRASDFLNVGVFQQFKSLGFYIVHLTDGKIVALDTASTHLGCITNWKPEEKMFENPCQGSLYDMRGINRTGVDPRPLERYRIYLDGEQIVVDKSSRFRHERGEWDAPASFINLDVAKGEKNR
jgi:Rieske Fe-S protein